MKKTMRFLSMTALALVGAMMTGCSSDDNFIDEPQQPENKSKVVTLTTTVSLDGGATTRTLSETGVKTFADGDKMAVIYKNNSDETVKAEGTLTSGAGTNAATFTFTLTDPKKTEDVTYIYPAAMAGATDVDYSKLNNQNGTLTTLGSNYDLCTKSGAWVGDNLPTLTLENQLAILAITAKDDATSGEITGSITKLTVSDGTNTYTVNRSAAAGPIYVAIRPTSSATINVDALSGTKSYSKTLNSKTYSANNGYSVSWRMTKYLPEVDLSTLGSGTYSVTKDVKITGTPTNNLRIQYDVDNCEVTLDNVNSAGTKNPYINGQGKNVNVKLKGTSRLEWIGTSKNVTIGEAEAGGTLILNCSDNAISGSTVTINGGTVKAKTTDDDCATVYANNLVINGGNVYLAGGAYEGAVDGTANVSGSVTLYGWNGSSWGAWDGDAYPPQQYASTDNIANPSTWTW